MREDTRRQTSVDAGGGGGNPWPIPVAACLVILAVAGVIWSSGGRTAGQPVVPRRQATAATLPATQAADLRRGTEREQRDREQSMARERLKQSMLPVEQQTEEGRRAIQAESVKQLVQKLASSTDASLISTPSPRFDRVEMTLADLRVRRLIGYAQESPRGREQVTTEIAGVIGAYARQEKPPEVLGQRHYREGWRPGYDSLITVLAAIDDTQALPLVTAAFVRHQAEIGNPVGQPTPEFGRWVPVDYGHNRFFCLYLDRAMTTLAAAGQAPPESRQVLVEYSTARARAGTRRYELTNGHLEVIGPGSPDSPLDYALKLAQPPLTRTDAPARAR